MIALDDAGEREAIVAESRPSRTVLVRPAPHPPRCRVLDANAIYAPIPSATYAVGNLLRRGNLALIVAFGSSLKTWLITDLVTATATGTDWLGRFTCARGDALIIDWESGEEEARRRLQAVARGRDLPLPVAGVHLVSMPDMYFTRDDFERELEALCAGRSLVAFDSLAAGSVDVDENDARFARGLQIAKRVAERTNTTMVVLHHTRKDPGSEADERHAVRGTGAIFAAADVVLGLRRHGGEEDAFVVRQSKSRGGRRVDPFVVRVRDAEAGGVTVQASDVDEPARPVAPVEDGRHTAIRQLLADVRTLATANDVARKVRGNRAAVLAAIKTMIATGEIIHHMGALRLAREVQP